MLTPSGVARDSARWCRDCQAWGGHHTDRHGDGSKDESAEQECGAVYDHDEEWDDDHTVWTCRRCGAEGFSE